MFSNLLLATVLACGGVERWDVKTGVDMPAAFVERSVIVTATIPALRVLRPPANVKKFKGRVPRVEDTLFHVAAHVAFWKKEADHDYHVIIVDDSGESMVVELPDPRCVDERSTFYREIKEVRETFDSWGIQQNVPVNVPVEVVGVGFFDFIHGQKGMAPNGIELHPVLAIERVRP